MAGALFLPTLPPPRLCWALTEVLCAARISRVHSMILVCLFYDNTEHLPPCTPILPSLLGCGDPAGGAGASVSVSIPTILEVRSVTSELCARPPPPKMEEVGGKNNTWMDGSPSGALRGSRASVGRPNTGPLLGFTG